MSPRTRAEQRVTPVEDIVVGDKDPMSSLARLAGLPLCKEPHIGTPATCTRAAGHSEGEARGQAAEHPSRKHVAADSRGIARKVWSR